LAYSHRRWCHGQRLVAGHEPHRWLTNRIKASATSNDQQGNQNTDDERRNRMPIVRTRVFLS